MIDVLNEETLTMAEAARRLPGQPHPSTVWRWCRRGCRGVRLEYARVGKATVTTPEALRRFAAEMTRREQDQAHQPADVLTEPTPRDLADAEAELAVEGI